MNRISHKLMLAVGLSAAVVTAVAGVLVIRSYTRLALQDAEAFAQQISETVKSSTRYDMLLNQREQVHEVISTIGRQDGINKIRIYNKEGEIILSTDPADVGTLVDRNAEACHACHAADQPLEAIPTPEHARVFEEAANGRMLGIINPIYNEASCWQAACHAHDQSQTVLGVLDVTVPLAPIDGKSRSSAQLLLLLVIAAVLTVSLTIWLLVQRLVLKPIALVVKATQRVASGDLRHQIPVGREDEFGRLAASFNDMTEKLAATQRQLVQSDKLASVGRLAAGVAHEINNPLTGVLTYASLLQGGATAYPELREDLDVIVRETKRCRDIVKGLLDFARQSVPEKREVHISEIIYRAASIMRNQFALRRIRLILDLQEDLPAVQADGNQIQQVLVNLLVNAADAMPSKGGTVTIETQSVAGDGPESISIAVRDTGCGIPQARLTKIFEPFYTTKGQQGNGLGLAVVWGIVENHRGTIAVDSNDQGHDTGTSFRIELPVSGEALTAPLLAAKR